MTATEIEGVKISTAGSPTLPAMTLTSSIDPKRPDDDGEIWTLKLKEETNEPVPWFLVSVIRWAPGSSWYKHGQLAGRIEEKPWEYQVDLIGIDGANISEDTLLAKTGFASLEAAELAALFAIQKIVLPINRLKDTVL